MCCMCLLERSCERTLRIWTQPLPTGRYDMPILSNPKLYIRRYTLTPEFRNKHTHSKPQCGIQRDVHCDPLQNHLTIVACRIVQSGQQCWLVIWWVKRGKLYTIALSNVSFVTITVHASHIPLHGIPLNTCLLY